MAGILCLPRLTGRYLSQVSYDITDLHGQPGNATRRWRIPAGSGVAYRAA